MSDMISNSSPGIRPDECKGLGTLIDDGPEPDRPVGVPTQPQVEWRLTAHSAYEAEIGRWTVAIRPDDRDSERPWEVVCTCKDVPCVDSWFSMFVDHWFASNLKEAKIGAELHSRRYDDLIRFEEMDQVELGRFVYTCALLGLGQDWRSHDPDAADEHYRRCLVAATAALDHLWHEDSSTEPGEPIEAGDDLIYNVFKAVVSFAACKIETCYGGFAVGMGTTEWRSQCRRSEAAARRATASLFGDKAMRKAQELWDRENAEWEAARQTGRIEPERTAAAGGQSSTMPDGWGGTVAGGWGGFDAPAGATDMEAFEAELDALGG